MSPDHNNVEHVPEGRIGQHPSIAIELRRVALRIWRALVFSSVYLAVIAAAEVLVVRYVLSLPPSPAPLIGGLVTFAIYANDRLVDVESDAASNPRRTAFVERFRRELYVFAAIAYGIGVAIAALGGPLAFGLVIIPGGIWFLYALDWLTDVPVQFERMKEVVVVNSLLVASAWSLSVVFLPLAFANAPLTPSLGVLWSYFFLATFVNAEISNFRDIAADEASGVHTLPTTIGVTQARRVLYALTLLNGVIVVTAVWAGVISLTAGVALTVGLAGLSGILYVLDGDRDRKTLAIAAECTRLPVLGLLLLLGFF
jgi:4-hydroxybenzoate polyprenyltransferase